MKEVLSAILPALQEVVKRHTWAAAILMAILSAGAGFGAGQLRDKVAWEREREAYQRQGVEIKELREEMRKLAGDLRQAEKQVSDLKLSIYTVNSALILSPLPHWVKTVGTLEKPGQILTLNDEAHLSFYAPLGLAKSEVIFHTDAEVFGTELGAKYWATDLEAIRCRCTQDDYLPEPLPDPRTGKQRLVRVVKWPIMNQGTVVAIAGVAIPESLKSNVAGRR